MSAALKTEPTVAAQVPIGSTAKHAGAYSVEAHSVAHSLRVNPIVGLSNSEVSQRRSRYGPNSIQSIRARSAWHLLVDQFASIVVALLGVAALVAWATADVIEALAILVVLVINALVGFLTEWQAGRALDALRKQTHMITRVRRA